MASTANKPYCIIFSCLLFILISFTGSAQNTILKRKISLDCENKRTEDVLLELSKKGRFYFSYSSDLVQKDKIISIKVKNTAIENIIIQIFDSRLIPIENGKYIILRPNNKTDEIKSSVINETGENTRYTITGYIIDANTGQKLSNATIYEIGKTNSVLTNLNGYYSLNISTKNDNLGLAYSRHNFKDTIIVIQPANHSINMRLKPIEKTPEQIEIKGIESLLISQDSLSPIDSLPLVKFAVKKRQFNLSRNLDFIERQHFQVSLIPQLGTNRLMSGNVENKISLNLLGGYSYATKGIELGGLINIVRKNLRGIQLSGISNVVGGNSKGVQIAGITNNNRKSFRGLQIAGISNIVLDTITGAQISGISNILKGKMKGMQLSGFSNIAIENVDGLQFSGFNNIARKDVNFAQITGFLNYGQNVGGTQISGFANVAKDVGGLQLSGFGNFSRGTVKGIQLGGFINSAKQVNSAQIAGYINVATKEIKGLQLAPVINIAHKVRGVQIGLINVADSVSGLNIGFFNFVKHGIHKIELSYIENSYIRFSFKTGSYHLYNIFEGSLKPENTNYWTIGYGLGTEFKSKKRFYFALDLIASYINEDFEDMEETNFLAKLEPHIGWNLIRSSGISFGPSFNLLISDWKNNEGKFLSKYAPYEMYSSVQDGYKLCGWIGGFITIRI